MFSGERINPGALNAFRAAVEGYKQTPEGYLRFQKTAVELGISKNAIASAFSKYKIPSRGINPALFRDKAPSLPSRADIEAFGLLYLYNNGSRGEAEDRFYNLIQQFAQSIPIAGKYVG